MNMLHTPRPPLAAAAMTALRQEIRRIEGFKNLSGRGAVRFGIPDIDNALPEKSFPLGVTHEFISQRSEESAATAGFLSGLLSLMLRSSGSVAWIGSRKTFYAPGLASYGFDPKRIVFIEADRSRDALWAMEEALSCKGLAAVVGEIGDADLTATRRLQLAAEGSGTTGLLLRTKPRKTGNSACVTRWHIAPLASAPENGLPGLGSPRWHAALLKTRGGCPAEWNIEWKNGQFRLPKTSLQAQPFRQAMVN
jgi:protein ImuA